MLRVLPNHNQQDDSWQFKANIHHIIQGHPPSTRILTIESKQSANLVLTGGSEGNIRMWRAEYSKLRDLTQYTKHIGPVHNISFLKYTEQIASCCGEIHVWDSSKCETVRKFTARSPKISAVAFPGSHHSGPSLSVHGHHHGNSSMSDRLDNHRKPTLERIDSMNGIDRMGIKSGSNGIKSGGANTSELPYDVGHSGHSGHRSDVTLWRQDEQSVYSAMTPFNYCCLLAGNAFGRIEFLDIGMLI